MSTSTTEDYIARYLASPSEATRPPQKETFMQASYLITYLGALFVRGYRIMEQRGNLILLSLMQYHSNEQLSSQQSRSAQRLPSRYRVILWEMSSNEVYMNGAARRRKYEMMSQMGKWLEEKEYNILFLNNLTFAVPTEHHLEAGDNPPKAISFYRTIDWIHRFNGNRHVAQKDEGTAMHELVEILIKGAGEARNPDTMLKLQRENKYTYDLFKVVNTINFVIGREILENGFETISAEKWMRKSTEKKFKRFDLLLRNQNRCKIIDWKFTKLVAVDKIKGSGTATKNKIYYQLAAKDFNTSIELQFYCFHEKDNHEFHDFTTASYVHKIEEIQIAEGERNDEMMDVEREERRARRRGRDRERSRDERERSRDERGRHEKEKKGHDTEAIMIEDNSVEIEIEEISSSGSSSVAFITSIKPPTPMPVSTLATYRQARRRQIRKQNLTQLPSIGATEISE